MSAAIMLRAVRTPRTGARSGIAGGFILRRPGVRPLRAAVCVGVRLYETPSSASSSSKPPLPQPNAPAPPSSSPDPSTPPRPPPPGKDAPLSRRVSYAWRTTPTVWYPLPLAVGALLLVGLAWKKEVYSQRKKGAEPQVVVGEDGEALRLQGPWQVHILGALPLRQLSRLWGSFNSLPLPVWFRPYGYRFYAWVFGADLGEIDPPDLCAYPTMGDFFYRRLREGARPIAAEELVSPADGVIVSLGMIANRQVEQVKGLTYSLDSLLGRGAPSTPVLSPALPPREAVQDASFASVNGIPYSVSSLMGSPGPASDPNRGAPRASGHNQNQNQNQDRGDRAVPQALGVKVQQSVAVVQALGAQAVPGLGLGLGESLAAGHRLYYAVVYLAPGDYHRFHSPASWVVEKRRHFSGELFSVNPWLVSRLPNLFVLNERVALLGKWRHGFFAFVPVGATNVGSIRIAFDADLRTNSVDADTRPQPGRFAEASYASASTLLGGVPVVKGDEIGGFALGSTIVLVFEAPASWEWKARPGEKVRVGQALGAPGSGS
ncbi:phosphatidylserine decarboxylase [Calocera cornea HHB12733]|uniref:Phosphatidylserine decarboxylase proenzyme 1, mitochondrial n=1 Tax=Calocera cornea HHB12733 TaxID=1353952 RepID=A0A165GSV1_9BASI|nr:phosphatidylserine decarboxylase [Calocera cornea HHB12733]